jgi:DNA mismatch repair protein MutH
MTGFDYRTASEDQIMDLARELPGLTLDQIPGARFDATEDRRGKGEVGAAIEAYFGIEPNQRPEADFIGAGIELKAVPLVAQMDGKARVKERTVISMIDYDELARETWTTASVRSKLNILFVFFEHLIGEDKRRFPIRAIARFMPSGPVDAQIRQDWEHVHAKLLAGEAHLLSERDGLIMGPCTKGTDSQHLRRQPFSDVPAKSRAFALKPTFTFSVYRDGLDNALDMTRLAELSNLDRLRQVFARYVGRTVGDVSMELGIPQSSAKDHASRVVRGAAAKCGGLTRDELEGTVTVRVPRVDAEMLPYEAVSFPAFRSLELAEEEWDESDLLSRIQHMLLIPVEGAHRDTPQDQCRIGRPRYWEPSEEALSRIEREWTMYRDLIRASRAEDLPTSRDTTAIHVRPHGKDSSDRDRLPNGTTAIRKSFWLNRELVQQILTRENA